MEFEELEKQRKEGRKAAAENSGVQHDGGMTLRERFSRVMHYQSVDQLPNFEFGYWHETLNRWREHGLPEWVVDEKTAYQYFGIEAYHVAPVSPSLMPVCEPETLEESDEYIVARDNLGIVSKINKMGDQSIPHFLEFPIKDRETWQPYKAMLENMEGRYPEDWDALVPAYAGRDYPLGIFFGSMIGVPRNLIGFENIAMMVHLDRELLEEIVETFCQCTLRTLERALQDLSFDFAAGWEDICFNSGPIVGAAFMLEVVGPRYRKIADLLNLHGVDIIQTDCDGNLTHILPAFLDNGINTMFPVEVHGGTDPVPLRRQYGKRLRFWGGVDKMIFLKDKAAVDAELERLRPVVEEGGFIPTVDHRVQSDADLDLYKHYLDRKREWFHVGGEPQY